MGYRGRRKSLKRLTAPKSWMLDKSGGVFLLVTVVVIIGVGGAGVLYHKHSAQTGLKELEVTCFKQAPKSSSGPHKARESFPMTLFLRNRLRYALSYQEVKKIVKQRLIKVDGKVRTDNTYPTGFMDVVTIERTNENFRILYDVKGRFVVHRIKPEEAKYKLCRVRKTATGPKNVPYLTTHDGRTIRYPDPLVKVNDTIMVDIASGKMKEFIKFDTGNLVMITGGHNLGRVGTITNRERHPGSFDIVHVKDALGHTFATRLSYVFVIGKGSKPWISLPRGKGVKLTIAEERDRRIAAKTQ